MPMTSEGIEVRLRALAEETLSRSGVEMVDLDYRREPAGWMLRVYIDRPGGVTLEDCQRVSQEFGTILEVEDPIPHQFHLEVSSPGLDRPLRKPADFVAARGRKVKLATRQPLDGRRHFTGRLEEADSPAGGTMTLQVREDAGLVRAIPFEAVEKAHIVYEWPEQPGHGAPKGRKRGKVR